MRDVLRRCREAGYEVHVAYFWLPSPEFAFARVDCHHESRRISAAGAPPVTPELPDDTAPHVGALMRDEPRITAAVAQAQADAVRRHRHLGLPLPEWRDGRVVEASGEAPTLGER